MANPDAPRQLAGHDGIDELLTSSSSEQRIAIARQLGEDLARNDVGAGARLRLIEVLDRLAHDLERQVRRAVAESLKSCSDLPVDLALTLASDVEDVANPILGEALALDDGTLLEIVAWAEPFRNRSVAGRPSVSPGVCDALIESGDRSVVSTLLRNEGARIAENGYRAILRDFALDQSLLAQVGDRPELPATVIDRLIGLVTEELRIRIETRHPLDADAALQPLRFGGEAVLIKQLQRMRSGAQIAALLDRLQGEHRLTPTLLLHALAAGDLEFFLKALARRAGLSIGEARTLLTDANGGIDTLRRRAGYAIHARGLLRAAAGLFADERRLASRDNARAYEQALADALQVEFPAFRDLPLPDLLTRLDQSFAAGVGIRSESGNAA